MPPGGADPMNRIIHGDNLPVLVGGRQISSAFGIVDRRLGPFSLPQIKVFR